MGLPFLGSPGDSVLFGVCKAYPYFGYFKEMEVGQARQSELNEVAVCSVLRQLRACVCGDVI